MALTLATKSAVRRHLGYPVIGLARTGVNGGGTLMSAGAGMRYHQTWGALEFRLNNLNPDEEARLTGQAFGAVMLAGLLPNQGDTLSVTFSGGNIASQQTVTVTAGPPQNGVDGRLTLLLTLAQAVSTNAVLMNAPVIALAPYGTGLYALSEVPLPECGFEAVFAFSISATGTGNVAPAITADGSLLPPVSQLDGINSTYGYVPILDSLEGAFLSSGQNMDTSAADVWKARHSEQAQRQSLYRNWQMSMADFLGVRINPYRRSRPSQAGAVRYY